MKTGKKYRLGIDIGSTTAKFILLDESDNTVFKSYKRHNTLVYPVIIGTIKDIQAITGDEDIHIVFTGSAGMGVAERNGFHFVQEVIAATDYVKIHYPETGTLIDIGGEDSKMIIFNENRPPDIRMNGNCAGGTGSFIDQMASLMDVSLDEINELVKKHKTIYPMASRCGVFAKTDIQNLISRKITNEDILASVFHAVSIQTLNTLSRGYDVKKKVMFTGGPFSFFPELISTFAKNLDLKADDIIEPDFPELIAAAGAAIQKTDNYRSAHEIIERLSKLPDNDLKKNRLDPLFQNENELIEWSEKRYSKKINIETFDSYQDEVIFVGVDSGSTTTKIVATGTNNEILFSFYSPNSGKPVKILEKGLKELQQKIHESGKEIQIGYSAVTGYGEDLMKAAFNIDHGIVETMAHYEAAVFLTEKVSFILDIGGQDMKAIFLDNGQINRIELNEACSSGCGSFIETFGENLGYEISQFAEMACSSKAPFDLGTRCTVFMNSKVKQALRENASINDIAAGLSYSVIKNALYKVLKLNNLKELGDEIVVQGGTFKNPSVQKALEGLIERKVHCSDHPEIMGAFGAALIAKKHFQTNSKTVFKLKSSYDDQDSFNTKSVTCKGCVNNCVVTRFDFATGKAYYSGNKCEKIFSNQGDSSKQGANLVNEKYDLIFNRDHKNDIKEAKQVIGIPRALNFYENYPFWHTLLTRSGFDVKLSPESTNQIFEKGRGTVMSDSICFPAKLVHGHMISLAESKVDRILYPLVVFEGREYENTVNTYNCPIVTGYPEVIKSSVNIFDKYKVPVDTPSVSFNDIDLLKKACYKYLKTLEVGRSAFNAAFNAALEEQKIYKEVLRNRAKAVINKAKEENRLLIVLANRPYHSDPLINQKTPEILSDLGVDVITDDSLDFAMNEEFGKLHVITQWSYPNRIYNAAMWVAKQPDLVQFVQLNSFSCGPDAIAIDEVNEILKEGGKSNTVIRIDEISSTGSVKIRLRSMIESLKLSSDKKKKKQRTSTKNFEIEDKERTIIAPLFSDIYSPFIPPLFELAGYKLVNLPKPDKQSVEFGLKYSNNEICYPATIIIGDIIKFLKNGDYDPNKIAIGITQTGGQCRASSYLSLIKKAMVAAGYEHIPVISVSSGSGILNTQPGFKIEWNKILKISFVSALYADSIAKMFYSTVVREVNKGEARAIMDKYLSMVHEKIKERDLKGMYELLDKAVEQFNKVEVKEGVFPKIGIVGEIYVKYNSYGNLNILDWLTEQGVEVAVPPLMDFFTQYFVNVGADKKTNLKKASFSDLYLKLIEMQADKHIRKTERINKRFRYYTPFHSIRDIAKRAENILSLANQYGEGWLIPAEIATFADEGVNNVVSLQPFGCIANQIISKGVEKRIRDLYPEMNLLFLDFDDGTSEVNVLNRLYFMVKNVKEG